MKKAFFVFSLALSPLLIARDVNANIQNHAIPSSDRSRATRDEATSEPKANKYSICGPVGPSSPENILDFVTAYVVISEKRIRLATPETKNAICMPVAVNPKTKEMVGVVKPFTKEADNKFSFASLDGSDIGRKPGLKYFFVEALGWLPVPCSLQGVVNSLVKIIPADSPNRKIPMVFKRTLAKSDLPNSANPEVGSMTPPVETIDSSRQTGEMSPIEDTPAEGANAGNMDPE